MNTMKANDGTEFIVLDSYLKKIGNRSYTMWKIQYLSSGYITEVYESNAKKGKVKDPYKISSYGFGYLGEFKKVPYHKQAKQLWTNMIKRCYCEKDESGYFGTAFVDERWKCFANFLEDLPTLDNFEKWLEWYETGEKYNLDKDLKYPGNKVYSREACAFVSEYENKADGARRGKPYTKKPKMGAS